MDANVKLIVTLVAVAAAIYAFIWVPFVVALPLLVAFGFGMWRLWRRVPS